MPNFWTKAGQFISEAIASFSEPFYKYMKTMNEAIYEVYKDSPVKVQIELIINRHELMLKDIDNLSKIILKLY